MGISQRRLAERYQLHMIKVQDLDSLRGKRVLLRADLNVAVERGNISSDMRIRAVLETVKLVSERGASVLLISHFGRPQEGHFDERYSLQQIVPTIENLLDRPVRFIKEWINGVCLKPNEVALGENVRFLKGETDGSADLGRRMGELCDVYVMDAFGTAHRRHASLCSVVHYAPVACIGLLCQHEIDSLNKVLDNPKKPVVVIISGAKIDGKLQTLRRMSELSQTLIVGGGIANTFLAAKGLPVGRSLVDWKLVEAAQDILEFASGQGCEIELPEDVAVGPSLQPMKERVERDINDVLEQDMILDMGRKTCDRYKQILKDAATVIWNGPVGAFEMTPFDVGTSVIAKAIAESGAFSAAGGGDTIAAIQRFNVYDKISYVSTGGGAFLEYLQGGELPALAALMQHESCSVKQQALMS